MELERRAAFSLGDTGGNPAGIAFVDEMPDEATMLAVAREVGYSETAFIHPVDDGWRVRYFAPETEVPFCGHATIAGAAALGARNGEDAYRFILNDATIEVRALRMSDGAWGAELTSPPTWSRSPPRAVATAFLEAFDVSVDDLDSHRPVRLAHAGATHLVVPLASRTRLARMQYPFEIVKSLMATHDVTTVSLVWAESADRFHARNAFAVGGVVEDPATGAAAAAFGGYLRDIGELDAGRIEILQGEDMGQPSRLDVSFDAVPGAGVRVRGRTRVIN